jgi:hypothetical protein
MRPLTAYWIGVVIVLAVLNGIRALPAGSRARRSMWNMGIAAAGLGSLAIIALKSGSQNAKHSRRSTRNGDELFNRCAGRRHSSAGSID